MDESSRTGGPSGAPVAPPRGPKPPWLKVRLPGGDGYMRMRSLLTDQKLNTICVSGRCPNVTECFSRGTATFLLLGSRCTRRCGFCDVTRGDPGPPDPDEPGRVAGTVARLGLKYAVVTSVTRDDLPDGGAAHFAACVAGIERVSPATRVEVLTPDFLGRPESFETVVAAGPEVFGHNLETCRRLYPLVRPEGDYDRALGVLELLRRLSGAHIVKSGFMLGLGESDDEVLEMLEDLRRAGCQVVTIGQYLRPSTGHLPVMRYVTPEAFAALEESARAMGFVDVVAGPLVRSSYLADRAFERFHPRPSPDPR